MLSLKDFRKIEVKENLALGNPGDKNDIFRSWQNERKKGGRQKSEKEE